MNNRQKIFLLLVILSLGLYIVSIFSPLMTFTRLVFFDDTVSLYIVLLQLFYAGEWFLYLIILFFTIIAPSLKFIFLLRIGWAPQSLTRGSAADKFLEHASRWSMLDVFVAALLVVALKFGVVATAQTHYGLYLFAVSVLIAIFCTQTKFFWLQTPRVN